MTIEVEREELQAYSALTIIDRIGMDGGVQKSSLKTGVSYMHRSGREYVDLPQYVDLVGHQKPWFSRSGAEKKKLDAFFSLTKAHKPLV